jgi:hypothetical protein
MKRVMTKNVKYVNTAVLGSAPNVEHIGIAVDVFEGMEGIMPIKLRLKLIDAGNYVGIWLRGECQMVVHIDEIADSLTKPERIALRNGYELDADLVVKGVAE